ncbi:MAG TPA: hypothetical protein VN602_09430 [Gemmatimonadaceae bacterium]|nr:hypothetical protein [Gemmatimonadaceae bacterium]
MAELTSAAPETETGSVEPTEPSIEFPLNWLLDHAAPPIQYRAFVDVARLPPGPKLETLSLASPYAIRIAVTQSLDGTWSERMLTLPKPGKDGIEGLGTIPAVERLLEYGWHRESPPLAQARRPLFRLLAEDTDPRFLYELRASAKAPDIALRGRQILREASSAALAHAGYEADPRLRGSARRAMERIDAYLDSALAEKPWIRIGNRHVLAENASPPSIYALMMVAHMPIFRSEHYPEMERLYAYLSQPKPTQEAVQMYGKEIITQPHLVMGDLLHNKNVVDADIPFALTWLEIMARLGFLKRNETWLKLFERFVDDCGRDRVWRPHNKGTAEPTTTNPYAWPKFPLETNLDGDGRWTDVTFRIGLIARLLGWQIKLV